MKFHAIDRISFCFHLLDFIKWSYILNSRLCGRIRIQYLGNIANMFLLDGSPIHPKILSMPSPQAKLVTSAKSKIIFSTFSVVKYFNFQSHGLLLHCYLTCM